MRSPIPTQIVSSDEYLPPPQTAAQREVEARLEALGASLARKHAMTRRRFFQTAAGMAAAYHVMNQVYGPLFEAPAAEAAAPELAAERARALAGQMIFDAHTHFVRDDPSRVHADPQRGGGLLWQRMLIARLGWNADLANTAQTVEDLKFGWRFPTTCRSAMASSRSGPRTARSRTRSSGATVSGSSGTRQAPS